MTHPVDVWLETLPSGRWTLWLQSSQEGNCDTAQI